MSKTRHVITPLRTISGIAEQILPVRLDTYLLVIALCHLLLPFLLFSCHPILMGVGNIIMHKKRSYTTDIVGCVWFR
jgi:hypothetical protein